MGHVILWWLAHVVALATYANLRGKMVAQLDYQRVFSRVSGRRGRATVADGAPALEPVLSRVPSVRGSDRGQALIEMALILPLIFVFILVIVDFGIALDRREVIQHGVREGARAGAVGASVSKIQNTTAGESEGIFAPADVVVCYVDDPANKDGVVGNAGDYVRVSGTFVYKFSVGSGKLLAAFNVPAPSITMKPVAEARLETAVTGATACNK